VLLLCTVFKYPEHVEHTIRVIERKINTNLLQCLEHD